MRHVYIRGMVGLVWIAAAIASGVSGKFEMTALYVIVSGAFLYSAYISWKKEKGEK